MKKMFLLAASLAAVCSAGAQFSIPVEFIPKIERVQVETGDIEEVLRALGLDIYKFSIPADSLRPHDVIFTIDEYRSDSLAGSNKIFLGKTYRYFTEEKGGPSSCFCDRIRIFVNNLDPENPSLGLNLVGAATMTRKIEYKTDMPYAARPFASRPFDEGRKIPLAMIGSFWEDENGIVRFCGSQELEADDEMLKLSPHYYIVSVELRPAE